LEVLKDTDGWEGTDVTGKIILNGFIMGWHELNLSGSE
jgi:hypothetical protein